jgi:hypothetical protein
MRTILSNPDLDTLCSIDWATINSVAVLSSRMVLGWVHSCGKGSSGFLGSRRRDQCRTCSIRLEKVIDLLNNIRGTGPSASCQYVPSECE